MKIIQRIQAGQISTSRLVGLGILSILLASLIIFMAASASGESWLPLGEGMDGDAYALTFDSGGRLYAAGSFSSAGGTAANHIAQWDGSTWIALGSGTSAEVYTLVTDRYGNLYAGGNFASAGGVSVNRVAKWDGIAWSALGSGMNAEVYALAFSPDGELYAGGTFTTAGGVPASRLAKWDGLAWSEVGGGTNGRVNALAFDRLGNLYVGGSFTTPASRIAKWDGSFWTALGTGMSSTVRSLAFDGNGNLYAGGSFASASGGSASHVARWDGAAWSALAGGMNGDVYSLAISQNGEIFAGGDFATADNSTVNRVARWDGSTWSALGSGMNDIVRALAIAPNGALHAGGIFTTAGGLTANHAAEWGLWQPGPTPTPTSLPHNSIVSAADQALFCTGETITVTISLTDVTALYGYQFSVNYDPGLATASAAFVNTFFDTRTNAIVPAGWDATCAAGVCRFAASLMEPGVPVSGSGAVAQIQFTGTNVGSLALSIADDILTDRESQPIGHAVHGLQLGVCGFASVSGRVALQGRSAPGNAGQVTLTDLGGVLGPYVTDFNPSTGGFVFNRVKVMPGGTNYQLHAGHGLYLGNRTSRWLNPQDSYTAPDTRLAGGDANNDGLIDLSDLTCIGGSFGGAPVLCGLSGSSDINADGRVNILDLVLAGSNYGLATPRGW